MPKISAQIDRQRLANQPDKCLAYRPSQSFAVDRLSCCYFLNLTIAPNPRFIWKIGAKLK
ncbi:MAG: hypothetical protein ACRC62_35510 [Microcoleus sp.]